MAEAARGSDILKGAPASIAEHAIGDHRAQGGRTRGHVEVEPAVIVQVNVVAPHRIEHLVEAAGLADIGKSAVASVAEKPSPFGVGGQAQIVGGDIPGVDIGVVVITRGEQVEPAVVVEVPKPSGKALARPLDPGLTGYVCEARTLG